MGNPSTLQYRREQKEASKVCQALLGLDAQDAQLTPWGTQWWSTKGDIAPTQPLGKLVHWPRLQTLHQDILDIPVLRKSPGIDPRWKSAVVVGRWTPAGFHPKTEIWVNLDGEHLYPHPNLVLRSLAHEVTHLIQMKQGHLTDHPHYQSEAYHGNRLDQEAKLMGKTIPLIPWPEHNLGDPEEYPYELEGCILPAHNDH